MNYSILGTILLLMTTTAMANTSGRSFYGDEPYRVEEFNVRATGTLTVQTSGGNILVMGTSESTARVEMHVRKSGRNLTPRDTDLSNFDITIEANGSNIIAKAQRNSRGGNIWSGYNNESISFTVYVPTGYSTDLRTSGGRIGLSNLSGKQELRTSGGSINMETLTGDVIAKTSGGTITIAGVHGMLDASTSGGTIRATDVTGDVSLKTSGGSIRVEDARGKLNAETSGGSINATILEAEGTINLATSGGSITVQLPETQGYDIEARGNRVNMDDVSFSGRSERDRLSGTINGGGIPVRLRTSGGSVNIQYQ